MNPELRELYGEILLDHGRKPRNHRAQPCPPACMVEGDNPLCGDRVRFFITIDNGSIADASFEGSGCAISIASASLATVAVRGLPVEDALARVHGFVHAMTSPDSPELPEDLAALSGVRGFPMRVKCATLAWHAMREAVESSRTHQESAR